MSAYDVGSILDRYNKVIAWGAGNYFEFYHNLLKGRITYIVDKNVNLHGKEKAGITVKSLAELTREQNKDECLIVVFNAQFEEIWAECRKLGTFDIIDIKTIEMLYERICIPECHNYSEGDCLPVLICAGMHALWLTNGARRFIDDQNNVLHGKGFNTLEVTPLQYYRRGNCFKQYLAVALNGKDLGILLVEDFINRYSRVDSIIIHSLYYNHEILKILLRSIAVRNGILYYLHDYYCICNNRFLYCQDKACLDRYNNLCCSECENRDTQRKIYDFHRKLFEEYKIKLIAPSQSVATIIRQHYKDILPVIIPHLSYQRIECPELVRRVERVAYIGVANRLKGWEEYKYIFGKLKDQYKFYCMGMYSEDDRIEGMTYDEVALGSGGKNLTMVEALKKNKIDIVYLGAIWPETFSYTYYEAYEAGCFIITNELSGNICCQVKANQNGIILQDADAVVRWLGDKEEVSRVVAKMNGKIINVKADESFLEYL